MLGFPPTDGICAAPHVWPEFRVRLLLQFGRGKGRGKGEGEGGPGASFLQATA